jgi:hypothetical protein
MNCQYCEKECKNKNSLAQHEIRCKFNSNKIEVKSNFILYNEKVKSGEIKVEYTNHFTKAEKLGLEKPKMSVETKEKISKKSKGYIWTKERRKQHSEIMIETAIRYPDSYSCNNVCGRTKLYDTIDSLGRKTKVNGGWERTLSEYLTENNINWTNKIDEEFYYEWAGKIRRYYPDFYLLDYDFYIEVKGYERDRDLEKWKCKVGEKLLVIKANEIKQIRKSEYDIFKYIMDHKDKI